MNAAQHPLLLILPFLCGGLLVGYYFPSYFYIAPAVVVGTIAYWMYRRGRGLAVDFSVLALCVFIGAQRMSACLQMQEHDVHCVSWVEQKAAHISNRLVARFEKAGLERDEMNLVSALVLGKREGLDSDVKNKFRQVGASHVLALSGMHLGVIYSLLFLLCIRWLRFSPFRWLFFPFLVCGLWTYTLMAGMPASLVRASSMLSLVCVGMLLFQTLPLLHTLFFSATIMLFVNPLLLVDVGFQLSFLAVLFIALAYLPLHHLFHTWPMLLRWPVQMLLLSLSAQIGTLPLSAYYFHSLPLLGPVVSLFLIPVTTVLIYAGLFTMIFPVPFVASFTTLCVRLELWLIDVWIRLFPSSMWDDVSPSLLSVLLVYVVLFAGFTRIYRNQEQTF